MTKRSPMRILAPIAALVVGLMPTPGMAWTRPAHMVTAAIAYDDLAQSDAVVIERIVALLEHHPDRGPFEVAEGRATGAERARRLIMECARWPDDAREGPHDHPSWHTQIRPVVDETDAPPVRPEDRIAMDGIEAFALNARVMANPQASPAERAVALCWVMHLAGDVHQPLHTAQLFSTAYPMGDRAGSLQYVLDPQTSQPVTLHWFWDDSVHRDGEPDAVYHRATELQGMFPRTAFEALSLPVKAADYPAWAEDSYALAASVAYAQGRIGATQAADARAVPDAYLQAATELSEQRVTLAGYRLADLLREAFIEEPTRSGV